MDQNMAPCLQHSISFSSPLPRLWRLLLATNARVISTYRGRWHAFSSPCYIYEHAQRVPLKKIYQC